MGGVGIGILISGVVLLILGVILYFAGMCTAKHAETDFAMYETDGLSDLANGCLCVIVSYFFMGVGIVLSLVGGILAFLKI